MQLQWQSSYLLLVWQRSYSGTVAEELLASRAKAFESIRPLSLLSGTVIVCHHLDSGVHYFLILLKCTTVAEELPAKTFESMIDSPCLLSRELWNSES